jgi:uncharacterized membrane protein
MQGIKRRIVYVSVYEILVILLSTLLLRWMSDAGAGDAFGIAIAASAIAILWNLVFNYGFERWESKRQLQSRDLLNRSLHALGFEFGLLILSVPLLMWWLDISLLQAVLMDFGLLVFFLFYTFAFNWAFDALFGLPKAVNSQYSPATK